MYDRRRKLKFNTAASLLYQVILVATGLILPRMYLHYYGSVANGLVTSVKQFLAFINLCDLGIAAVITSALYKPLAQEDAEGVRQIFGYCRRFFHRVGCVILVYIAALILLYPSLVAAEFPRGYVITLIAALGISQFAQYFIGISCQILLSADQRTYIQLTINGVTLLLNTLISIVVMYLGGSLPLVHIAGTVIYLFRPLLMMLYVRRHYDIRPVKEVPQNLVTQKWNGIVQHISYMIYENTDVLVLSVLSTLQNVSVYSIYTLVVGSIKSFITAAFRGFEPLFGDIIARRDEKRLREIYDLYDWSIHTVSTLLYVVTALLIRPFVLLYTGSIQDADYNVPVFAVLITLVYFCSALRNAMYVMVRAAGHYRQTQGAAITEAALNVLLSVLFVSRFGLVGVTVGTLAATVFFLIYLIRYFSAHILRRSWKKSAKQLLVDLLSGGLMLFACSFMDLSCTGFWEWICQALAVSLICGGVCAAVQAVFFRGELAAVCHKLFRGRRRKEGA